MKNIQVIDGAINSVYEVYKVSDRLFKIMFPGDTDVAFLDEARKRLRKNGFDESIWNTIYKKRVDKKNATGIQGTLHLTGSPASKEYFPTRRESDVVAR